MNYTILFTALATLTLTGCSEGPATTATAPPASASRAAKPDNTETNVRDRSEAAQTPIDQNENQRDISTTADIRKRVVDTEMSVNAQNVKIITRDGKVVLRGPVQSEEEKSQIDKLASDVAGPANVDNQLEVQP